MEQIRVENTNGPDFKFEGELIAKVGTPETAEGSLSLYKTKAGNYIVIRQGWPPSGWFSTPWVGVGEEAVIDRLGYSQQAKALYAAAGFVLPVIEVE